MKFVLLVGEYLDLVNGRHYQCVAGQQTIVSSDIRLDEMHPNKFRLIEGSDEKLSPAIPRSFADVAPKDKKPELPPPVDPVVDFLVPDFDASGHVVPPKPKPPEAVPEAPRAAHDARKIDLGTEMTEDYPEAAERGLRVFKRKGRLFVGTDDAPDVPVGAKGGYVGRSQVLKAIDKYTATYPNV